MDHEHARLLMLFYRPGGSPDLAADDVSALEAHLAECPSCAAAFRSRSAADARIASAVKGVPVPGGLKAGLIEATVTQLAADARRGWTRTAVWVAVAAAAGLLGYSVYRYATRPGIDAESLSVDAEYVAEQPGKAARDWLDANGLPLPEPFDLRLVRSRGDTVLNGQIVPGLRLMAPNGQEAEVYFLPPGRFDLSKTGNAQASNAAVRFYPGLAGGWAVLVRYTGNDLRPFLVVGGTAAL